MLVLNRGKTVHSDLSSLDPMKKAFIVTNQCLYSYIIATTLRVQARKTVLFEPLKASQQRKCVPEALDREQPAVKTGPLYLLIFWETKIQVSDYKATTILRAYFT